MSQMSLVKFDERIFSFSWTTGLIKVSPKFKIRNDDDALAYAMYLTRHGNQDEAEHFLDRYCS